VAEKEYEWRLDEIAASELLWCAAYMDRIRISQAQSALSSKPEDDNDDGSEATVTEGTTIPLQSQETEEPYQPVYAGQQPNLQTRSKSNTEQQEPSSDGRASPIRVPVPFPLPQPSHLSKALLPFSRRVRGLRATELDIEKTVERTAEANGLPIPVFQRPLQRWFDVCLLIDYSPSMEFWGELGEGVAALFRWQGIFRDVRVWQFDTNVTGRPRLLSGVDAMEREVESLIMPGQDRLFVVVTDTLGKAWRTGKAFEALAVLGAKHPIAIAHVFPQYLWPRTALEGSILRPLVAPTPGCANDRLVIAARLRTKNPLYRFPIFNLSEQHFSTWAKHIAEDGGTSIQGVLLSQKVSMDAAAGQGEEIPTQGKDDLLPEDLVNTFWSDATPEAAQLASILAAVPLIPTVMRLAQEQFMPDTRHWHLAEVFFSGLVQRSALSPTNAGVANRWYEFRQGVRDLLLQKSPIRTTTEVWREIGSFIEQNIDSLQDALGLVPNPSGSIDNVQLSREHYFAEVRGAVLKTWGGEFAHRGQELIDAAQNYRARKSRLTEDSELNSVFPELQEIPFIDAQLIEDIPPPFPPPLQTEEFTVVTLETQPEPDTSQDLEPFEFTVVTLLPRSSRQQRNRKQSQQPTEWELHREQRQAYRRVETLPGDIPLEMIALPGGRFRMGSPLGEPERYKDESPQHEVNVEQFWMGRYPVTQRQWQAVVRLSQVERQLNPNPSRFKGDDRPVERVSWYDATEFCARLSAHTGRAYRLPSEAEWEYACRADTTTPFHFGEMITTEVANYRGGAYNNGPTGERRGKTTLVNYLKGANAFGLSDMHGNVWEWCQDHWHSNYKGAPIDGSAWLSENDKASRIRRGGSWNFSAGSCRSASRSYSDPLLANDGLGFRVCCSAFRTL
jgi:formylglycine-generating enzyme required for sulfatase activity